MKVLIIEDEDLIFQVISPFLESYGCRCEHLKPENIKEVLKCLEKDFDVILCDYMMPEVTGWDIFNNISEELRKKFIILTGGYIDYEEEKIFKASKIKIVHKPFDIHELYSIVKEKYESQQQQ